MSDEPTQLIQPIAPEPSSPSSRSRAPWVVAVVAIVLALALGGVAAWAYQREDPALAGLRSDLDTARASLADAQAQLDAAKTSAGDTAQQVADLQAQIKKLKKKVNSSVPNSQLPVVEFDRAGLGNQALFDDFQTNLVDPMNAWSKEQGIAQLLVVIIEIPINEGEPYSYQAVWADGQYEGALFGTRGEPVPTWQPVCTGDECAGLD